MENIRNEQTLFLELRELRPELAGFLIECQQGHISSQERAIINRRLQAILRLAAVQTYPVIAKAASLLAQMLQEETAIESLQRQAVLLRETALYALTFAADIKDTQLHLAVDRKPRLVVADDDRIVREMMQQLFAHQTELHIAEDGKEAYRLIEQHRPDLVILDDFMPGMTGLRLIETLRDTPSLCDTRVLMLTGSDRPQDKERAIQAGAVDYVTKPFDPSQLVHKVREQLTH